MFRKAYKLAAEYTFPIAIFRRSVAGAVTSQLGSFILLNEHGWILTAGHIIESIAKMSVDVEVYSAHQAKAKAIREDAALSNKERGKKLSSLGKLNPELTSHYSILCGVGPLEIGGFKIPVVNVIPELDLAIAQISPFEAAWCKVKPKLLSPDLDVENGASLCTMGFPFSSIPAKWIEANQTFELDMAAFPLPRFPIDGILTRTLTLVSTSGEAFDFPALMIETSHPGLLGQSGGPIFDVDGTIWGIQSRTNHLPLGFDNVKGYDGKPIAQFLNVGLGVSAKSICHFLKQLNVAFDVA